MEIHIDRFDAVQAAGAAPPRVEKGAAAAGGVHARRAGAAQLDAATPWPSRTSTAPPTAAATPAPSRRHLRWAEAGTRPA